MKPPVPLQKTQPLDTSADAGPRCRGGLWSATLTLSAGLLAFGLGSSLYIEQQGRAAALCLSAFGLIAALASWVIFRRLRFQDSLPRSHSVLAHHLGFKIDFTCSDVAMTAFLQEDRFEAGKPTSLLCFVENYSSRQRVAKLIVGPHPHLGLAEAHPLHLHLAAGQAAVYILPLHVSASLPQGEHDLPLSLTVSKPTGSGVLLPGARRHLHNLWNVHFAAPFSILPLAPRGTSPSATPRAMHSHRQAGYHSLASVSESAPRLEILNDLA